MKKQVIIIIGILVIALISFGIYSSYTDNERIKNNLEPKFTIKTISYGGSKVTYWGLGYKVIRYVGVSPNEPFSNNIALKYGSWFMKSEDKIYTETDYAYVALEELPQDYTMEQAINNNCFVVTITKTYNENIYTEFISNVKNKKDGFIRAIYFTDEGDMGIRDVEYENDKNEFYVSIDETRDRYSSQENRKINKYKFTKIIQEVLERGEYTYFENEGQNDRLFVLFNPITNEENANFFGKVVESNSNYIIVEPNEGEEERKSSDKFSISLGENNDAIYEVGTNVKITYTGLIRETYPAQIDVTNIEIKSADNFEILFYQKQPIDSYKTYTILDKSETEKYDYTIYGHDGSVNIRIDGKDYSLKEALVENKITMDEIIAKANQDLENSTITGDMYKDGGSMIYKYDTYTIIKCHTLDGNRDVYIGVSSMTINDVI